MKPSFKRLRRDDGQALVELAFVLPLLLLFIFGIIDFGLALNQYNTNTNLANIGVRQVAIIGNTGSVMCNGVAETNLQNWIDCEATSTGEPKPSSVCVADTVGGSLSSTYAAGDPVKVEVTTSFNWLTFLSSGSGYIGKVVNPTSNITATATMRMEQAPDGTGGGSTAAGQNTFLTPTCTS